MKIKSLLTRLISSVLIFALILSLTSITALAIELPQNSKIDSKLLEILEESSDNEPIPVSIWFNDISKETFDKQTKRAVNSLVVNQGDTPRVNDILDLHSSTTITAKNKFSLNEIESLVSTKRNAAKQIYSEYNRELLNQMTTDFSGYDVEYICSYAPNVILKLGKSDICNLALNDNVASIFYYEENFCESTDDTIGEYSSTSENSDINLSDCLKAIESRSDLTGEGVKIGLIDSGVPMVRNSIIHRKLSNNEDNIIYDPVMTVPQIYYSPHADSIATLLVGKSNNGEESFTGIVPDAQLYCTSKDVTGGWKAGIEWLLDSQVSVISISISLVNDRYAVPNDVSKWIDHLSYQHNVTVVAASGYFEIIDGGYQNISPLAYSNNAIVVGGVTLSKNEHGKYSFSESFFREGSAYSSANRYYPHVVAPCNIDSLPIHGNIIGNSYSTPLVAGLIAQLIQLKPYISTNPTLIKSLVMTGANGEKSGESTDTSGTDMDRKYGAGVVNVQKTIGCLSTSSVAKTYTGSFSANSFGNQMFYINIPEKATNVRLALTWNAKSTIEDTTHNDSSLLSYSNFSFLRLTVTSPTGVVHTSFDVQNPFQLLTFDIGDGEAGVYTVNVSRNGPTGYALTYSLAAYGCDYITY